MITADELQDWLLRNETHIEALYSIKNLAQPCPTQSFEELKDKLDTLKRLSYRLSLSVEQKERIDQEISDVERLIKNGGRS